MRASLPRCTCVRGASTSTSVQAPPAFTRQSSSNTASTSASTTSKKAERVSSPRAHSEEVTVNQSGVVGTWPNSFEPLVLDSRYLGHYRDPSKHDEGFSLPVSRRGRASWFAPSTATSVVSKVIVPDHETSKARSARHEMEKAWGAHEHSTSSSTTPHQSSKKKSAHPLTALLMPGSGSQYVGMASFLDNFKAARETWEEAEEALSQFEKWRKDLKLHELPELKHLNLLDWPVWQKERSPKELQQVVRNGPQDELTRSSNSQPAICITSIALLRTLEREFGIPLSAQASYFAGHSSGEYSACVASGVLTFSEGVHLTRLHGLLTSRALQLSSLKTYSDPNATDEERAQMSAIMLQDSPDSTPEKVSEIIRKVRSEFEGDGNEGMVEIASYNSSKQLVLSGSRAGVLRACEKLEYEQIAARAADLPVFAPFHCSFMAPAAAGMTHAWKHGVSAQAPRAPIVSNLDAGLITTPDRLIRDIVASISAPVQWSSALELMRNKGVKRFIFVGPGKALANLARKEVKTGNWRQEEGGLQIGTVATEKCMLETSRMCEDLVHQLEGQQDVTKGMTAEARA